MYPHKALLAYTHTRIDTLITTSAHYLHRRTYVSIHPSTSIDTPPYPGHTSTHVLQACPHVHTYTRYHMCGVSSLCAYICSYTLCLYNMFFPVMLQPFQLRGSVFTSAGAYEHKRPGLVRSCELP